MKQLFSFIVLMLITSMTVNAQKENVYSKTFGTDKATTMIINLDNTTISIEPSKDGKVHISSMFEFKGYSKKERKQELSKISTDAVIFENNITLTANKLKGDHTTYTFNGEGSIVLDDDLFGFNNQKIKDSIVRKSKDSLIEEINKEPFKFKKGMNSSNYDYRFKIKGKDGKIKNFKKGDIKIFRSVFRVKVPPYVRLAINGKDAIINFQDDMINELNIDIEKGSFNAKKILNNYNQVKMDGSTIKAEYIIGGNYILNNIINGKIGVVNSTNIISEFSKIEIGEIQKGVKLTDFNSEYWIYNFSEDFERFDIFSEYSKIHHFNPKTDYSMRAFGHNTINYIGKHQINMQPTKNGEKHNMMERKRKNKGIYAGHINLDVIHGIIYTYNDTFKPNKN